MSVFDALKDDEDFFGYNVMEKYDDYNEYEEKLNKYLDQRTKIQSSDISIFRLWVSLNKSCSNEITIKPRANNIFYSDCCFHKAGDIPVCINDNKKTYFCYGCHSCGSIFTLISRFYKKLSVDSIINILNAFINNDISELTEEEKNYYDKIFKYYDSEIIDKYYEESKRKTEKLEHRIISYYKKYGNTPNIERKMAKRLCCVKSHIKKVIKD